MNVKVLVKVKLSLHERKVYEVYPRAKRGKPKSKKPFSLNLVAFLQKHCKKQSKKKGKNQNEEIKKTLILVFNNIY